MENLLNLIKTNIYVQLLIGVAILYIVIKYYEPLENTTPVTTTATPVTTSDVTISPNSSNPPATTPIVSTPMPSLTLSPQSSQEISNLQLYNTNDQESIDKIVAGQNALNTDDLLPKYDDANEFAKQNPVSKILQEQNFLQSGYRIGINTVFESNKIPYYDLRSMPPIPKSEIGPWNNSSYEESPGSKRRQFELN